MAQRKSKSTRRKKAVVKAAKGGGQRELVVVTKSEACLRIQGDTVATVARADTSPLEAMIRKEKIELSPLFGVTEDSVMNSTASLPRGGAEIGADMATYYHVKAPDDRLDHLVECFCELDTVEAAYVKPPAEAPVASTSTRKSGAQKVAPLAATAPSVTPNFTASQGYLNPAPEGIDARYAWGHQGGRGEGIKIIDCEWGWNVTHEDLLQRVMGVSGVNSSDDDHGTAVLGEYSGDGNAFGVTGICSEAIAGAASFEKAVSTARTIREAADRLDPGDILLLEIHRWGPNSTGVGQEGYIAVEWWPDDFAAIRYAVAKGIVVVEAAGNGGENFDDPIYDRRPCGFPTSWRNPFNPSNPSSEAVVVGAGAPPPGTHGQDYGPDRSRLGFSNYGQRVDCQGWGEEVTTCGYGSLQGGDRNRWYTDSFNGTSSASPIVVGALGCVQGILKSEGAKLLTSPEAITHLRATGSPQQDGWNGPRTQRIGNRPDLRQLIPAVTNRWHSNRRVLQVHAKKGTMQVWARLDGTGWIGLKPQSPDGVTNTMMILCSALAQNRVVDVYMSGGEIQQATLR